MKKFLAFLLAVGMISIFSLKCFAAEIKIGYVDVFQVFSEFEKTKEYDKMLEDKKTGEEKKLEVKQTELKKMQEKLSLLKDKEQEKEKEKFATAVKNFRDSEQQIFDALKKDRDTRMKEIVDDINKVVDDYAVKNGYTYIITKNALLYGDKNQDLTAEILKIVNANYASSKTAVNKK